MKVMRPRLYGRREPRGFTLVEVLVSLVIVSVALLSLGGFAIGVVGSGQASRERLTAVHLAEQVMEYWRNARIVSGTTDYAPLIASDCVLSSATSIPSYPVSTQCTPKNGVRISYSITVDQVAAAGPLFSDPNLFQQFAGTPQPMIDIVTVSWVRKDTMKNIVLTHITSKQ